MLTGCRDGRQLAVLALWRLRSAGDPAAGVPHRLQPFLLDVLQLDGDGSSVGHRLPQLKLHPRLLPPTGDGRVHHGTFVRRAEVPEAAPAVQRHLYPTVVVVGAAKRRRLAAA